MVTYGHLLSAPQWMYTGSQNDVTSENGETVFPVALIVLSELCVNELCK